MKLKILKNTITPNLFPKIKNLHQLILTLKFSHFPFDKISLHFYKYSIEERAFGTMSHSNCDLVATWQLSGSGHEQKFRAQLATRDTFPSRALGNSGVISEFSVLRPHSWILVSRANLAACLSRRLEFAGPGGESGGESLAGNSSALADGSARVKWKVTACSAGHALKIWLSHTRAC